MRVLSGWASPMISSSILSTKPVALYQVKKVLLPAAIFGAAPPEAPAPAPGKEKPSDLAPADDSGSLSSPKGSPTGTNGGSRRSSGLAVGIVAVMACFW